MWCNKVRQLLALQQNLGTHKIAFPLFLAILFFQHLLLPKIAITAKCILFFLQLQRPLPASIQKDQGIRVSPSSVR